MDMITSDTLINQLRTASRVEIYWNRIDLVAKPLSYWERARHNLNNAIREAEALGYPYAVTEIEDDQGICLILTRKPLPQLPGG